MAHVYTATVIWERDGEDYLDREYSRGHLWRFDGGVEVPASSSPLVVKPPLSREDAVDPEEALGTASLRSGDRVSIVDGAGAFVDAADQRAVAATLLVAEGPDAGRRFELRSGAHHVGRDSSNEIVLSDPMVSKRHARLNVSDVVEAFRLACTAPKAEGEVFNIASGSRVSVTGLLAVFNQLLDLEVQGEFKDARPADVRHSLAETIKAQEVLGFRPRVGLHEGLVKTMLWYRRALGKSVRIPRSTT